MASEQVEAPRGWIATVGHSTRGLEDFLGLAEGFGIELMVDIRRFPSSKTFPHFNQGNLRRSLEGRGVAYRWEEALGGRRSVNGASRQEGLSGPGFRSYAEHMNSPDFRRALSKVLEEAEQTRVALMCAEKLFWKCHRLLVADAMASLGWRVKHILDRGRSQEHRLSPGLSLQPDGSFLYLPVR